MYILTDRQSQCDFDLGRRNSTKSSWQFSSVREAVKKCYFQEDGLEEKNLCVISGVRLIVPVFLIRCQETDTEDIVEV
jgi:hypothetical protein